MTHLSDEDWECICAYHDGELSPKDTRKFKARLAAEAELASTLMRLQEVSNSLSTLRPVPVDEVRSRAPIASIASRLRWLTAGALLASLVTVVAMGAFKSDRTTLLDIHSAYLRESFTVIASDLRAASTIAAPETPDLTAGNLKTVALSSFHAGTVAHYSGQNGCRLSYFRALRPLVLPTAAGSQTYGWSTGDGFHHAIIATGMDVQKFSAISAYLQKETHHHSLDKVYASVRIATENAAPCIG
jgi:hypothetical protein